MGARSLPDVGDTLLREGSRSGVFGLGCRVGGAGLWELGDYVRRFVGQVFGHL